MATTSIADKLAKLEKKIAKRQATIAEEQTQLDKELSYPDDVPETIRQQKRGKMYDIFQPACRQCNCAWAEQRKKLNSKAICRKMITVTRTLLQFSDGCAMI